MAQPELLFLLCPHPDSAMVGRWPGKGHNIISVLHLLPLTGYKWGICISKAAETQQTHCT